MCPFQVAFQPGSGRGNGAREKAIRVLRMAWMLQKDSQSIDQLAEQFHVSRRTVYRDLRLMDDAGLPLVSRHGAQGYRIVPVGVVHDGAPARRPWA